MGGTAQTWGQSSTMGNGKSFSLLGGFSERLPAPKANRSFPKNQGVPACLAQHSVLDSSSSLMLLE